MRVDFNQPIQRKNTFCTKYDGMAASFGRDDLLPLWIADMDFPVPDEVTQAIARRISHPVYGYNVVPAAYYDAFAAWQEKHHGWTVETGWLCHTPGVLTALSAAILAFTKEGDEILIQPPVYFPFRSTIEALGRKVLNSQLQFEDGKVSIHLKDLKEKAKRARMLVFCSPHNPSGRVWNREELEQVEGICRKHDLLVFSDEIHSDIVYAPNKHIVFASLSPWSREHSIVAMAPSKTFNIAGLEMSVVAIPNRQLREDYQYLLRYGLHAANPNTCGLAAAQAAYEYGEPWYRDLLSYLEGNLDYLDRALREQAPQVRLVRPQATYIPLLDMGALGMDSAALKDFMANQVGAALNAGDTFGPGGEQFMRINVATQRENLEQFVSRLRLALERLV